MQKKSKMLNRYYTKYEYSFVEDYNALLGQQIEIYEMCDEEKDKKHEVFRYSWEILDEATNFIDLKVSNSVLILFKRLIQMSFQETEKKNGEEDFDLDSNDKPGSKTSLDQCFQIFTDHLGEEHPYIIQLILMMCEYYKKMTKFEELDKLLSGALYMGCHELGLNHKKNIALLKECAQCKLFKEDRLSAKGFLEMAISIKNNLNEIDDYEYAIFHIDLAYMYLGIGEIDSMIKFGIKGNDLCVAILEKNKDMRNNFFDKKSIKLIKIALEKFLIISQTNFVYWLIDFL